MALQHGNQLTTCAPTPQALSAQAVTGEARQHAAPAPALQAAQPAADLQLPSTIPGAARPLHGLRLPSSIPGASSASSLCGPLPQQPHDRAAAAPALALDQQQAEGLDQQQAAGAGMRHPHK